MDGQGGLRHRHPAQANDKNGDHKTRGLSNVDSEVECSTDSTNPGTRATGRTHLPHHNRHHENAKTSQKHPVAHIDDTTANPRNLKADLHVTSSTATSRVREGSRFVLFCILLAVAINVGIIRSLPFLAQLHRDRDPQSRATTEPMSLFSEDRAMQHVRVIAKDFRWVGSAALDRNLEYIEREINAMVPVADRNGMLLEVEAFTGNGSYPISMLHYNIVISYSNILSVVARISPRSLDLKTSAKAKSQSPDTVAENEPNPTDDVLSRHQRKTLLINAHVDSGFGSPGANDNVVGVAAALESLRAIARLSGDTKRLVRPIVFLFNGAEEPLLAGAHHFVTSHPWSRDIVTHINLESIGSGSTYHLFQMGPQNAWLADVYAKAVLSPSASAVSSDIFEGGLVPADTDFRIFKEYGIPGYDFALFENPHIYHTIYDDIKHVSSAALSYAGKILLLPLAMELAGNNDAIGNNILDSDRTMSEIPHRSGSKRKSRAVFFDVLCFGTVVYSEAVGKLLNYGVLTIWLLLWLRKARSGPKGRAMCWLRMVMVLLACIFAIFASGTALAQYYLHVQGRPLAWYGSYELALAIYVPILFIGATVVLQLAAQPGEDLALAHESGIFAVSTIYALELLALTAAGFRAAYIPLIMLLPCVFVSMNIIPCRPVLFPFLAMITTCVVFGSANFYHTGSLLLSLMGRAGNLPSEVIASALVAFSFCQFFFYPLFPLFVRFPGSIFRVRKLSIVVALFMAWVVWILPELTLPHRNAVYSRDAPKRVLAYHFRSPQLSPPNVLGIISLDAIPVDVNTTVRMLPFSDRDALKTPCTWGALNSTIFEGARAYENHFMPPTLFSVDDPLELAVPVAKVVEEHVDNVLPGHVNVSIEILAPDSHMVTLRVPVKESGGSIVSWSFDAPIVDMGASDGCWVRHIGRGTGVERLQFSVLVEGNPPDSRPRVVMDVTSTRAGKSRSEVLRKLYFPIWAAPVYVQSTGASFSL